MKPLIEKRKCTLAIFFTLLIFLGTYLLGYAAVAPVSERTPQVRDAIVATVPGIDAAADVTETHLAAVTTLNVRQKNITALKADDFDGLTTLSNLNLYNNQLSRLPDGIFEGLTALTTLRLGGNVIDPFPMPVALEKVVEGQFKAVAPTGATFDYVLSITVTNGSIIGGATTVTIPHGRVESETLTLIRTPGTTGEVTVDIQTLPRLPRDHYGYALVASDPLPLSVITGSNTAPVFIEGSSVTRSVAENTAAGTDFGAPITATDAENDTLTYTLSGADASAFDIESTTGQLKTKASLDYETQNVWTVTINASDSDFTNTITVTINVTDIEEVVTVNTAPSFYEDENTTRVVFENTPVGLNIGNPVSATDAPGDFLTYTLGGVHADAFDIESTTGQLKTKIPLDYETRRIYSVTITVDDEELSDTIRVIISVIAVSDPVISAGFVPVIERTPEVRDAIVAVVPNATDAATVTEAEVAAITHLNLRNRGISSLKTGDFSGMTALRNLNLYGNQLDSLPTGIFTGLTALTSVRLGSNLLDPLPLIVSLQSVGSGEFKAVMPTGAPFNIVLPMRVTTGSIRGGVTSVIIPQGSMESGVFTGGGTGTETPKVAFRRFPGLPINHYGYIIAQSTVCNRTEQVAEAITDAVGVDDCSTVTEINLATITSLDLSNAAITALKAGDFDGMLSLTTLYLDGNTLTHLPRGIFDDLVSLRELYLNSNKLTTLPRGIFRNLTALTHLYLQRNDLRTLSAGVFDALSAVDVINLQQNELTSLPGHLFEGTPYLRRLLLSNNNLTSLPAGIFEGLTQLHQLYLGRNPSAASQLPLVAALEKVGTNRFKAVMPSGAPFGITLPIKVTNGTLVGGATAILIPKGSVESRPMTVTRTPNTIAAVTVDIRTPLPTHPTRHNGYVLVKSATRPLEVIEPVNLPPIFTDGANTIRTIAENVAPGTNVGNPVTATYRNKDDTLTYTLSGNPDAAAFDIDTETGQLKTKAALDFETQKTYSVTLTVSDGKLADTITVTINVTDVNETPPPPPTPINNAPVFTDGTSTTRTIAENTDSGTNIGTPVAATDVDGDTLTYTLGGTDANSFNIVSTSGQIQTKAALDYETKASYSATVSVSDGNGGSDTIDVTINVTDVNETPPPPPPPPTPINNAPVFTDGTSTTRTIAENTASGTNIGTPVAATDIDGDTLTYTLGGTDADSFGIVNTTGQIQTSAALDYETKDSYSVTVSVSDGNGGSNTIDVTINVTDVNETPPPPPPPPTPINNAPVFTDGTSTTRTVAENTDSGTNIGTPVAATDVDGDTLTYTLGGTDADAFGIVNTTGQIQTSAALDYETKNAYSVTVSVSDGKGGTDSITVTINVTDVNETPTNNAPIFTDGTSTTRTVAENTAAETNIGTPVAATDADNDTLIYTLGGTDAGSFSIVSTSGQLQTNAALDRETKASYSVTVSVSDGKGGTDSINVTINVTDANDAPVFTEGSSTTRTIAENTAAGTNIGTPVAATDQDNDTLTYTLGGTDPGSFSIVSTSGQLQTKAALDRETKASYSVTVSVSDGKDGIDSINVTINVINVNEAPTFTEGSSTTRSIAENTASGTNIGTPVAATDADNDTLIYTLGGTDAGSFSIVSTTGQIQTKAALDYETKSSYSVTVSVSDGNGGSDTIDVTINVADVNETPTNNAPVFTDGTSTTRTVAENTDSGTNIGTPVAATDQDGDSLAYSLSGTDAGAFSIVSTSGQIQTSAALDHETKDAYSVTVSVSDSKGGTDSITVTINVTDANDAPVFTEGSSTTRAIAENTEANTNIGTVVKATDQDNDTLTYTLSGTDAGAFSIVNTSGQIQTNDALDHETDDSYSVTVSVSDGKGGTDSITVTINVTDANDAPVFTEGSRTTRAIAENTASGTNIGTPVAATDQDNDTLTYTLGGTDAGSFSIVSTSGQLQTNDALDRETKASYSVTVSVSDGKGGTDSINVTINVTNVNEAPTFTEGSSTTRAVAENTASGTNIGNAIAATDMDGDTLTYTLGGTDAAAFGIVSTSGQLQTKAALDYETKNAYSVKVSVSDGKGGSDSITVTINVTDVNETPANNAPVFTDGTSTTRTVAENTASGTNIGTPIAATDQNNDTLTYTLSGTDAGSFSIVSTSGQLQTSAALDHETDDSYSVTVSVSDSKGGTDSITVTISVTDANDAPVFTNGDSATRSIAENTDSGTNIGTAVKATDQDNDTLTYTLGGTDAATFSIANASGQLQTKAALDYETKNAYSVTVTASDGTLTDTIDITINVTNINEAPTFTEGDSTTRTVAENTDSGTDIGSAVAATDADNDTLTYTLGGDDADAFSIVSTSGQLQTKNALDYETDDAYAVTVSVSDGNGGSDSITVAISVTDANDAPVFTDGDSATRSIAENTDSGTDIGEAVKATDQDGDTLTYTLEGDDKDAFSVSTDGQLQTSAALDYETKSSYSVTLSVSDSNSGSDSITVTISVTDANDAPVFTEGGSATRSIAENTDSGTDIGEAVKATDQDGDTLTYTLGGTDSASFDIVSTSGQLQTKAALDHETKNAYSVTVTVSDETLTDTIDITINVTNANEAPTFTEGSSTTRTVAENTAASTNIGSAVAATDADNDTLTYTLGGTDAASFSIANASGQLQTSAALDYETKTSYSVTVSVSDSNGGTDSITVTISVTDANDAPVFTDGDSATRSIAENTPSGTDIGKAVKATDQDGDTLTYTLGGNDKDAFSVSTDGQLQTSSAALDYETKSSYSVTLSVSDGNNGSDSITVTINVTNVSEIDPPLSDRTQQVQAAIVAAVQGVDAVDDVIDTHLAAIATLNLYQKDITSLKSGDFNGLTSLTRLEMDSNSLSDISPLKGLTLLETLYLSSNSISDISPLEKLTSLETLYLSSNSISDISTLEKLTLLETLLLAGNSISDVSPLEKLTSLETLRLRGNPISDYGPLDRLRTANSDINLDINLDNNLPVFSDGASTTRAVAENTAAEQDIGAAVAATDADNDTLTYSLGGDDAASFDIVSTSGQIQTSAALDYETKSSYSVTVTAYDGRSGANRITVTINVTDVNEPPVFTEGTTATRSVAENTATGKNIGTAVAATDGDADTLTYSLSGDDAASFGIASTTGQLQTSAALDYETKTSYSVTVSVTDGNSGSDSITVTINVTDVNEIDPPLSERTQQVREAIVAAVPGVTSPDDVTDAHIAAITTLNLTNEGITSLKSGDFNDLTSLEDLRMASNSISDISPLEGLTSLEILDLYNNTVSDISALEHLTSLRQLDLSNNTVSDISALEHLTSLRWIFLSRNSVSDISALEHLTSPKILDLSNNSVSDVSPLEHLTSLGTLRLSGNPISDYGPLLILKAANSDIELDITFDNNPPVFSDGASATRTIEEDTATGTNIGAAVAATDDDNDVLTYSLGGDDADAFGIVSTTGQIQTKAALDYQTQSSYTVTVTVYDGNNGGDRITVTINVTEVNETPTNNPPVFTDGTSTTRSVAEHTASEQNIGAAVAATDADNDTLTYTLSGTDAGSFSIVSTTGQLQTSAALDYETKREYTVTVSVSDSKGGTDSITVTINVTDANEAPTFTDGDSTTRSVAEHTASGTNIGAAVAATDANNDTLTYSLAGTDADSFGIVSNTGQLQTSAALDYETKTSYSVKVSVSDGNGGSDSIDVTINVTDANDPPVFTDGDSTTRTVVEHTSTNIDIGDAIAATDLNNDVLTYSLGGTDEDSFGIVSTTGQLRTNAALDYETKTSYSVTVSVSDGNGGSDSITVTINVTDINEGTVDPPLSERTQQVREAIVAAVPGIDIADDVLGTHLAAITTLSLINKGITSLKTGDFNGLTSLTHLDLNNNSISDISALELLTSLTQLKITSNSFSDISSLERMNQLTVLELQSNSISDISALKELTSLTHLNLNNNSISDISALKDVTSMRFLRLASNSISDISVLEQLTSLGLVRLAGNPILDYGPLRRLKNANPHLSIDINLTNNLPVFSDGNSTTRAVDENTATGQDIGTAVAATDADNNTLTYSLSGDDADAFSIVSTSGQIQTSAALDYETKSSYSVTVTAYDGRSGADRITVTINVTDVNEPPVFTEGTTATRSVAENTATGTDIGTAVAATDPDTGDTLTYSLSGTDAASFGIASTTGQLQTSAALDYETKTSYSVTVSVSDSNGSSDSIAVTINVTNVSEIDPPLSERTQEVREAIVAAVPGVTSPDDVTETHLAAITILNLVPNPNEEGITSLKSGDFNGLTSLTQLHLPNNSISDISALEHLTSLRQLDLSSNSVSDISALEDLTSLRLLGLKNNSISDISVLKDLTSLTWLDLDNNSISDVSPLAQLTSLGTLRLIGSPILDYVPLLTLQTNNPDVEININLDNNLPVFSDGDTTTRTIAEDAASGTNIGNAITATDADSGDTLTYSLGGTDANSFDIDSTTGQIQTKAALDYQTKSSYTVTVTAYDGNSGAGRITVTINVTEANNPPVFTEGTTATRSVAENTTSGQDIGTAVAATDADNDTLTYTLGGTDADSFGIVGTSGQLQTKAALDYETKNAYSVTVSVSDGNGGNDSITVAISVTDANDAPVFTDGNSATRAIAENTAAKTNIGTAVAATDQDNDTLTYTLGGTDAASFGIVGTSGQLQTKAALDYETKNAYSVTVSVSDGNSGSDTIDVTINVTDVTEGSTINVTNVNKAPTFTDGDSTTRTVAENTAANTNIDNAIAATDADEDTLTYTLGGTDADSFGIVSTSGQIQTKAALDYETKNAYSVTVTASDGTLTDTIDITIKVTNINEAPTFTEGDSTTRAIAENTDSGTNIGNAIAATDADNDTLTYSLSGTDAEAFSIVSTTGQIQTKNALDYETKDAYSVTVSVSDSNGDTDSITVTINVTDANDPPVFTDGTSTTRAIAENTAASTNIGTPIAATDADNDTITYTLGGTDAASFSIVSTSGQLQTNAALDYETDDSYSVTVSVSDGNGGTDSITVTINVTDANDAPVFADGTSTTRAIAENTTASTNIGNAITATDADNDTLTYSLSGPDADAFSIVNTTGQIQTKNALDYETKDAYSVTVSVSDSNGDTDSITVTINVTDANDPPVFTDGTSTTRAIAENTAASTNIGTPIAATDADNDTITYTLGGTDAAAFNIVGTTGQIQTKAALDYETKTSHSVTVSVSDGNGGIDSIDVTINVTDANDPPVFTDGTSTTRSTAENTAANTNIGNAIAATDQDNDTITYTLGGTDAAAFNIVGTTGQLQTKAALDYETMNAYAVTVTASDGTSTDTIDITIKVTDANDPPVFTDGTSTTRSTAENTAANTNIGNAIAATDQDNDTITYSLSGTDAASFSIVGTTGQLQTKAALDYETMNAYAVTVTASDGTSTDTIDITIKVININEAPTFTEGDSTTRPVAENTAAGTNIGNAIAATDADSGDTLTYSLSGTDADAFGIVSTTGQLQTKAALDYETKNAYSVTATASDGTLTDTINITIKVTDANDPPVFTDGDSATRAIAENTAAGQNIGTAVAATDADNDTLTYSLSGTDADAFSIVSTTGQIQTKAALDYEKDDAYSLTVSVSDGNNGSDSITVTINVTNINEAPSFRRTQITLSVAEDATIGTAIDNPFQATDPEGDTLTYSLRRSDRAAFSIDANTGQLKTDTPLDYETKNQYNDLAVRATDPDGQFDAILVTISVTDANDAPVFDDGDRATRSVAENTAAGQNIGTPVAATDADNDTITYTLGGTDAAAFSIVSTTGQLQTSAALDYETKNAYAVTVSVSDGKGGTDSITVAINVTDVNEPPTFTDGDSTTRTVAENTATGTNIGAAVSATDANNDTLTYTLSGADAEAFSIVSTTGQIQTNAALDHEKKNVYSVTVSVSDGNNGSDSITVTINVTNINEPPRFSKTKITLSVVENVAIGTAIDNPFQATDPEGDILTYSLRRSDRAAFSIDANTGQLKTDTPLNYEAKNQYNDLAVRATDPDGQFDAILVTISVIDANDAPVFDDGDSARRSIAENTTSSTNIGTPVAATDADNDTITYTLGGTDAGSFSIVSTSGQLQTKATLDYETNNSYSVTVSVSDGNGGTDSITVTINVTDANDAPVFADGTSTTRAIAENTAANTNIGNAITATDADNDTITYSLDGDDADAFSIVSTTGQIQTKAALDYEKDDTYSVTVTVSDGNNGSDSITVIINVTNINEAPSFPSTKITLSVAENVAIGTAIGNPFQATDPEDDTLTYSLRRSDRAAFSIDANTGQLKTDTLLDYETKNQYNDLAVRATDPDGQFDAILVTISVTDANDAPVFTDGDSATRAIAENTEANTNIGAALAATDPDNDTLTYTLGGTDAAAFSIVSTSGQLQTSDALDYETKSAYSVTVSVSDSNGGSDAIDVTINVTDVTETPVNNDPMFAGGDSTTRSVAENTAAGTNIGNAIAATDADSADTLTYTLGGTDAAAFSITSTTGQLQTKAALDHEKDDTYSVTVTVSDGNGGSDSITVTINVTNINEAPKFPGTTITLSVAENATIGTAIGNPFQATDPEGDTLTYSLRRSDRAAFSIDANTGQLKTDTPLDYEAKNVYNDLAVRATDPDGQFDAIVVTVNVTDVPDAPAAQSVPSKTVLLPNFPNPFNPETWIPYQLAKPAKVTLTIYNMRGVVVRKLKFGHQAAGFYHSRSRAIHWDGRNMFGEKVVSGVYFYTLKADDYTATRKLLIRK